MTTCRDIISDAARMARIIAPGDVLSSAEAADGLVALQSLYNGWAASGMFGWLKDVLAKEDYEAQPGERVEANGFAVMLPTVVDRDGVDGPPKDLSFIQIDYASHVYDAGAWVALADLTLDSDAPLSARNRLGLSAALAVNWVEAFGSDALNKTIVRNANLFNRSLMQKGEARPVEYF